MAAQRDRNIVSETFVPDKMFRDTKDKNICFAAKQMFLKHVSEKQEYGIALKGNAMQNSRHHLKS